MTLNEPKLCCFAGTKQIDFPKIRYKNLQYFNLVHAHKPKFGLFLTNRSDFFFLASFLSFFQALLLSEPFALHTLSGCHKKLGVNYGQSIEMGP